MFCLCDKQPTVPDALLFLGWRGPKSFGMVGRSRRSEQRWRGKLQHPDSTLRHCPQRTALHLPCSASPPGSNQDLQTHTGSVHVASHTFQSICVFIHSFPLLEAPVLLTQRRVVSVFEGDDVQLTCKLRASYLPANEITWFNNRGIDIQGTSKYTVLRTSAWANLTVRDVHQTVDSGEYRCSTSNAVGGTAINITLQVKSKAVRSARFL